MASTPKLVAAVLGAALAAFALGRSSGQTTSAVPSAQNGTSELRAVVIVTRHGVRSPTDPHELDAYSARPWPAWQTPPGQLTPHGATLMTSFGRAYRSLYAPQGLLPANGCPAAGAIYIWADVDQRTRATGTALLDGLAPNCGLSTQGMNGGADDSDPLFHPVPKLGKADAALSLASISGSLGASPAAIAPAYGLALARLDAILGCRANRCTALATLPASLVTSPKTGLVSVEGSVDLASTAVENMLLAYADGKPAAEVGWGELDRATLLELSQLHILKFQLNTENWYTSRVLGSNILAHLAATLDQAGSGTKAATRVPVSARFVAFVGHDSTLEALAGLLRLRWLMSGYQPNDTPPGGALVFELRRSSGETAPFVRTFFTAQSLDQMRELSSAAPARVAVFIPGCPSLDCPLPLFDRVVSAAVDPAFVGNW